MRFQSIRNNNTTTLVIATPKITIPRIIAADALILNNTINLKKIEYIYSNTIYFRTYIDLTKDKIDVQNENDTNSRKIAEAAFLSSQKGIPIYLDLK